MPKTTRKTANNPIKSHSMRAKLLGEPLYSIDLDCYSQNVLQSAFVLTRYSFGKIIMDKEHLVDKNNELDHDYYFLKRAKQIPGYVAYVDEEDIPNKTNGNTHSGICMDTTVFVAKGNVQHKN